MGETRKPFKDKIKVFICFFCTKMPFIGLAGAAISWALYLFFPRGHHSIEDMPHSYWRLMEAGAYLMMISGALFLLGFIGYLIYRPLGTRLKWLKIIVRIILASAAAFITVFGEWLSLFIFSGSGY